MGLSLRARFYLWGVVLAAFLVALAWFAAWDGPPPTAWGALATLAALAIAAQHFPLTLTPRYKVTMSTAAYFAALLLGGMPAALLLIAGCQLIGGFTLSLRRNPGTGLFRRNARSVLFNAGQVTLAAGLAGAVYYTLLPRTVPARLDLAANLWALPLTAATMYLVNSFAVAIIVGLQRGVSSLAVWREGRGQDILQFAALYLFGLVTALIGTVYPWAPTLLALPVAAIYLSLKRTLRLLEERAALADELAAAADLRDRYTREHARRVNELSALHGAGRVLAGTLEPAELHAALLGAMRTVIACDAAALYVVDDDGATRVAAMVGQGQPGPEARERQVLAWAVAHSQPLVLNGAAEAPAGIAWPEGERLLAAPLLATGQARGAVALRRAGGPPFAEGDLRLVESIASQAAVTLHNTRLHAQTISVAEDLRAVLESIEPGVLMTDRLGRIRFANRRLGELLALDPRDLVGRRYAQVIETRLAAATREPGIFTARLRWLDTHPEQAVTDEVALMRPIGRTFDRFSGPVRDPESGAIVGRLEVYTDVTEERQLERAKDEFLATASHELKTPITTLGGYLELLQHQLARPGGGDPARLGRYATTAQRELRRLRQLSEDLLEVARIEAGRLTLHLAPLDLAILAREMVDRFAAHPLLLERGHRVSCRVGARLPSHGDARRLEQVVGNLLENAFKYSPDGGEVVVEARQVGDEAILSVRDSGIGISPEERGRLFQPFYRAQNASDGSPEGLGLGLHISRGIVEGHGGRLWVEEAPGGGSIFSIALLLDRRSTAIPCESRRAAGASAALAPIEVAPAAATELGAGR